MIPKSLSATSVSVAELCLMRWASEHYDKASRLPGEAAMLGTAVHGGLELYVKMIYIEKQCPPDIQVLIMCLKMSFNEVFGHSDTNSRTWKAAVDMARRWFDRIDIEERGAEVVSVESKENFELKTSAGPIPFNFIFDRLDYLGNNDWRIVDYKSSAWPITPEELRRKIQARVYALAIRIKHPDANKVWVQFDMLRHSPVTVAFTKEECRETYAFLKRAAERIIATKREEVVETLNNECRFCTRVAVCSAVTSNTDAGGIITMPVEAAIERYGFVQAQMNALKAAESELKKLIEDNAQEFEWTAKETEAAHATWKTTRRRTVDGSMAAHILPPNLLARYTRTQMTMADFDALMEDPGVTPEMKKELGALVTHATTRPSLKVELKKVSESDD